MHPQVRPRLPGHEARAEDRGRRLRLRHHLRRRTHLHRQVSRQECCRRWKWRKGSPTSMGDKAGMRRGGNKQSLHCQFFITASSALRRLGTINDWRLQPCVVNGGFCFRPLCRPGHGACFWGVQARGLACIQQGWVIVCSVLKPDQSLEMTATAPLAPGFTFKT